MRFAFIAALALALVACGDLIGADFDRADRVANDAGTSADGTLPVPESGECPNLFKRCANICTRVDDPKFGCSAEACSACAQPLDSTATCGSGLTCDFDCPVGFEKKDGRCIGFRVTQTGVGDGVSIAGHPSGQLFAAFGTPWTQAVMMSHAPNGEWLKETLPDPDRYVTGMVVTASGDVYASTTGYGTKRSSKSLFHRSVTGSWEALSTTNGLDVTNDLLGVWASSPDDIYVATEGMIRHFHGGVWTAEPVDITGVATLWGADSDNVFLVGQSRASEPAKKLYRRASNGKWYAIFSTTDMGSMYRMGGLSGDDFYVIGIGKLRHVTRGSVVTDVAIGTNGMLGNVWARSPNEVWIVGADGLILVGSDSTGFTRVPSNTTATLTGIWSAGSDDIFISGAFGGANQSVVLRRH